MPSVDARVRAVAAGVLFVPLLFAQAGDPVTRAEQLAQAGKIDEAIKVYDESIRKDPTYAPFHLNRGLLNVKLKKWREALNDCTSAMQLQRPGADVYYCRAAAYQNTGKNELAKESLQRALALNPNHPGAVELMAIVAKKGKDRDQAIESLSEVIRVNPGKAQAYLDRAKLYEKNGDLYGALEDISNAVRIEPKDSSIIARAELLTKLGEYDRSIAAFSEMLRRSPNTPAYLMGRGKALLLKGDAARAQTDFTLARRLNPAYAHVMWQFQSGAVSMRRQVEEAKATAQTLAAARTAAAGAPAGQAVASAAPAAQTPAAAQPGAPPNPLAPAVDEAVTPQRQIVLTSKKAAAETPAPTTTTASAAPPPTTAAPAPTTTTASAAPASAAPAPAPPAAAPQRSAPVKPIRRPVVETPPVEVAKATPPPPPITAAPPAPAMATVDASIEAVRRHLAEAAQHTRAKQPDQAITSLSEALKIKADLPGTWTDRAKLYLELGKFDNAIADLSESLKHKPNQADVLLLRCTARMRSNDPKAAVADCAKAVELNPKSADAIYARAQAYAATRQFVAAAQDLEDALEQKNEFPEAHLQLGQLYIELEQYVLALHHFTVAVQQRPGYKDAYKFRAIVKQTLGDNNGYKEDLAKSAG